MVDKTNDVRRRIVDMTVSEFNSGRLSAEGMLSDDRTEGSIYFCPRDSGGKTILFKVLIAMGRDCFNVGIVKESDRCLKGVFPVHGKRGAPITDRCFSYAYDGQSLQSFRHAMSVFARDNGSREVYVAPEDTTNLAESIRTIIDSEDGNSYEAAEIIAKAIAEAVPGLVEAVADAIRDAGSGVKPR
jgi:hypothetical protein